MRWLLLRIAWPWQRNDGRVWTFGWGSDGRLGHGDKDAQWAPKLVEGLAGVGGGGGRARREGAGGGLLKVQQK